MGRVMRSFAIGVALALLAAPAQAQTRAENVARCESGISDDSIRGCSALIQSGHGAASLVARPTTTIAARPMTRRACPTKPSQTSTKRSRSSPTTRRSTMIAVSPIILGPLRSRPSPITPEAEIALSPNHENAYYNRAFVYFEKGRYDLAIADYSQAIALKPDFTEAYGNRGHVYDQEGLHDQAIADYSRAIALEPNDIHYMGRGLAYDHTRLFDQAIADYGQAIALKPDSAAAYYDRGMAYDDKGLFDQAIADYTQAIALKPDHEGAFNNRGVAYGEKGFYDQAIADETQAIALKPDDAAAYKDRAISHHLKGEDAKGLPDADKAVARWAPQDAGSIETRGGDLRRDSAAATRLWPTTAPH